ETPTDEVVEGETPTDEVVEGETPVDEVVEGETPTDEVVENAPSDTSDSNFTAQDLDIGENTTSNPNTTEGSTSDAVEPSDSSLDTEIETPDSFDSKPINTDQDPKKTPVEPDAKTTSEAQDIKDLTESSEIMEKLVEEAELREAKNSSEADEEVAQEEIDKEAEIEKEEVAEEKSPEPELGELDRVAYENQFQEAPNDLAIFMQEEYQLTQLIDNSGLELYGTVPSAKDISHRLAQLAEQTGKKPAFINISLQSNQLQSFVVLPEQTLANTKNSVVASSELNSIDSPQPSNLVIRKTVKDTSRKDLLATANQFREEVSDVRKLSDASYMASAQELYEVLIRPIEAELEANDIDILVFSMDSGLRLLPVAALHDGEQFLVEKYAMGIVPSFGLTDTRYVSPAQSSILAMGASEFEEQIALPTMPIELNTIIGTPRHGELFLNEQFTISNFVAQNSRETPFSIIHLGTHAEFKAGNQNDSYIQFYDDKLKMPQLQKLSDQLGWNTDASPVELLVLSACETALGDEKAELGFAGLAVQAGVKSALASLWYVSDLGTLALMGEFYDQLSNTLIKAEALRQTQLEMLQGNVKVADRQVKLSSGADLALPEDFPDGTLTLAHPYFWSSFTLIGNWN
ncbi:MAG: CHAT domain-containing protein, partial [Waterburya sp.]